MFYFDVILLSDVISSIGPKISDADTYISLPTIIHKRSEWQKVQIHVVSSVCNSFCINALQFLI